MADEHVTRIKATDGAKKDKPALKGAATKPAKKAPKPSKPVSTNRFIRGLKSFGGYFKGAWSELKQVRWPTRSATWSLTGAVLLFSAFFIVLILLLDAFFKYIFELLLA